MWRCRGTCNRQGLLKGAAIHACFSRMGLESVFVRGGRRNVSIIVAFVVSLAFIAIQLSYWLLSVPRRRSLCWWRRRWWTTDCW